MQEEGVRADLFTCTCTIQVGIGLLILLRTWSMYGSHRYLAVLFLLMWNRFLSKFVCRVSNIGEGGAVLADPEAVTPVQFYQHTTHAFLNWVALLG